MLNARVLILEARFYADLADEMIRGATAALDAQRVAWSREWVPGTFELPAALAFALRSMAKVVDAGYDGFIALGCVIEGETDHYEHICREASRGLMDLAVAHAIPLGFGVLTCQTYAQAEVRARVDGKDKGGDAARACLRMIELKRAFLGGRAASSRSAPPSA